MDHKQQIIDLIPSLCLKLQSQYLADIVNVSVNTFLSQFSFLFINLLHLKLDEFLNNLVSSDEETAETVFPNILLKGFKGTGRIG